MAEKIAEIHSISAANGWYIDNGFLANPDDCVPVCFFALVTLINTAHNLVDKLVIPVDSESVEKFKIGESFDNRTDRLIHSSKIEHGE